MGQSEAHRWAVVHQTPKIKKEKEQGRAVDGKALHYAGTREETIMQHDQLLQYETNLGQQQVDHLSGGLTRMITNRVALSDRLVMGTKVYTAADCDLFQSSTIYHSWI